MVDCCVQIQPKKDDNWWQNWTSGEEVQTWEVVPNFHQPLTSFLFCKKDCVKNFLFCLEDFATFAIFNNDHGQHHCQCKSINSILSLCRWASEQATASHMHWTRMDLLAWRVLWMMKCWKPSMARRLKWHPFGPSSHFAVMIGIKMILKMMSYLLEEGEGEGKPERSGNDSNHPWCHLHHQGWEVGTKMWWLPPPPRFFGEGLWTASDEDTFGLLCKRPTEVVTTPSMMSTWYKY